MFIVRSCHWYCDLFSIIGPERFSNYTGYSDTFSFAGDFVDTTPRDHFGRRKTFIVAIDALKLTSSNSDSQYHPDYLERELNKAYCGFSSKLMPDLPVATGSWGCGAFGGESWKLLD